MILKQRQKHIITQGFDTHCWKPQIRGRATPSVRRTPRAIAISPRIIVNQGTFRSSGRCTCRDRILGGEGTSCDLAVVVGKGGGTVGDEETDKVGQLDRGTICNPCKYLSACSAVQ